MDFNGPMYEVFTERDKDVILDWIESLRPSTNTCVDPLPDVPTPIDLPGQVAKLIADNPIEQPLDADKLVLAFKRWDQQVGTQVAK